MRRVFTIPGAPVGKARPRVVVQGGMTHAFKPPKNALYERSVSEMYKQSFGGQTPLTGPITLVIRAYYPIPQSWAQSKKAKALCGLIEPTVKPDLDNVCKLIADSCNGIAWEDDKQITEIRATKEYSAMPRVEVEIWQG